MNKFIIRNTNLLSNCEKFVKNFARMIILFLLNFYVDYDQIELYSKFQDMIAFQTFLELLKMIIIFMKAINSVEQFM